MTDWNTSTSIWDEKRDQFVASALVGMSGSALDDATVAALCEYRANAIMDRLYGPRPGGDDE